jgi:hypothetical protein
MSTQRNRNDQSDIPTVAPTAEHEAAQHGKSRPQPGNANQQPQPTITTGKHTQAGSDLQQVQRNRRESLPIDDLDLNEQGDDKLTGDERGGD